MKKTSYWRFMLAINLGIGTSLAPITLLIYGLSQFNIIRLVGKEQATGIFGVIAGIVSFSILFLAPCGGYLSDRTRSPLGRRRFWIIFGSIAGAAAMFFLANSSTLTQLTLAWIAVKFFYGVVTTNCLALVPEQIDINRFGRVHGIISAVTPLTIMLTTMLFMGYFSNLTVQNKIIIIALTQLVCAITTALLIETPANAAKQKITGNVSKALSQNLYPNFRKYPEFTWALLTKLMINLASASLIMMPLMLISRFNLPEKQVFELSALMSSGTLILISTSLISGYLSDRIRKQKIFIIISALIIGSSMCIFAFGTNLSVIIVGQFILLFGMGIFNAVGGALINRVLPSQNSYAKDIAIINTTYHIATSVISFCAPYLISLGIALMGDDGYTLFFLVFAFFSFLPICTVLPIPEVGKLLASRNNNA
ncbi:sugar (Glycoside-Pentoside-Hexuronide) transporter [Campylobacter jejuni]|nr:sugar (Glycoside-Pentoside-Hexuronide) transporter [Campylobacter jejuni]